MKHYKPITETLSSEGVRLSTVPLLGYYFTGAVDLRWYSLDKPKVASLAIITEYGRLIGDLP